MVVRHDRRNHVLPGGIGTVNVTGFILTVAFTCAAIQVSAIAWYVVTTYQGRNPNVGMPRYRRMHSLTGAPRPRSLTRRGIR